MKTTELNRLINLGLKTIGSVGRYLNLMKKNHTELEVLIHIKQA